ncbi:hypothetical protein JCM33374_g5715 [Metschnikowia sp. JCM 33374]|nr:hypothetical protein JCM33374_g5715 [Metschnikowia sp. JCM 33374]
MTYWCQKCNSEIILDTSFQEISRAQAKLLVSKVPKPLAQTHTSPSEFIPQERLEKYRSVSGTGDGMGVLSQNYNQLEHTEDLDQSFVYISDSENTDADVTTNNKKDGTYVQDTILEDQLPDFSKIKTLNQVFDILSVNQDVGHPMCSECSDLLIDNYKLKFDQSQREKEYYISFLRKLKERESDSFRSDKALDEELKNAASDFKTLEQSEHDKLVELETLEERNQKLKTQLETLNKQLEDSKKSQLSDIYQMKNTLSLNLQEKQHKLDQTKALYNKQLNHLDELRKFNVFKKLFDISFEGDYGLINGFRLGYKVPWPECNVALGQIISMLQFLKGRLGIELYHYKLVPLGSKSYVVKHPPSHSEQGQKVKTNSTLQMYSSNEFTLGKLFNFNKLDVSMMALLDILSQFESQLSSSEGELSLPYKASVLGGTLGGKSIRVTSNGQWTDSCRYLLVNLNWILSYAGAQQAD